jgi:hypothetical protein
LAHSRDGGRPSWRPVIGVVLPPLWHQGHKGQPMPRTAARGNYPRDRGTGPQAPVAAPEPVGRAGVVAASDGDGRRGGVGRDPGARDGTTWEHIYRSTEESNHLARAVIAGLEKWGYSIVPKAQARS